MTSKEIRKSLKAGKKVIFNRHIWGAPSFERLPVIAVRARESGTWVKIKIPSGVIGWSLVQPGLDDYVSVEFPPVPPVTWEEK